MNCTVCYGRCRVHNRYFIISTNTLLCLNGPINKIYRSLFSPVDKICQDSSCMVIRGDGHCDVSSGK